MAMEIGCHLSCLPGTLLRCRLFHCVAKPPGARILWFVRRCIAVPPANGTYLFQRSLADSLPTGAHTDLGGWSIPAHPRLPPASLANRANRRDGVERAPEHRAPSAESSDPAQ